MPSSCSVGIEQEDVPVPAVKFSWTQDPFRISPSKVKRTIETGPNVRSIFFFSAEGLLPSILQFFSKRGISAGTNKDPRPCRNDLLRFFFPFVPRHVFRVLRNEVCSVFVSSPRWADAIANRSTEELRTHFCVFKLCKLSDGHSATPFYFLHAWCAHSDGDSVQGNFY